MPFPPPPFPPQFDVGNPGGAHVHFDPDGIKVYDAAGKLVGQWLTSAGGAIEQGPDLNDPGQGFGALDGGAFRQIDVLTGTDAAFVTSAGQTTINGPQGSTFAFLNLDYTYGVLLAVAAGPQLALTGTAATLDGSDFQLLGALKRFLNAAGAAAIVGGTDGVARHITGGSITATTSAGGIITITHGLGLTPTSVVANAGGNSRLVTTGNFTNTQADLTVWTSNTGAVVASTSLTLRWMAFA